MNDISSAPANARATLPQIKPIADDSPHEDAVDKHSQSLVDALAIVARVLAMAAFAVTVVGFIAYPRPHGTHWTLEKTLTFRAVQLGACVAMLSFLICLAAGILASATNRTPARYLSVSFWLNVATIAMALFTPLG